MAGRMQAGFSIKNGDSRLARAFCEGVEYRLGGTAVARPKANNPYSTSTDNGIKLAWDNGWDFCDADAGGSLSASACALSGTVQA